MAEALLSHLFSVISGNVNLVRGYNKELGRLKDELEMIRAVLRDAEGRIGMNNEDAALKLWMNRLEDFAYSAHDLLDEIAYDDLRCKVENVSSSSSSEPSFMPKWKIPKLSSGIFTSSERSSEPSIVSQRNVAEKIKEIFESLDNIKKQASDYGLLMVPRPPHVRLDRETDSFVNFSDIVGRENDVSTIVQILLTCQNNLQTLSVLPIVGMGGVGKTTLAKLVYNNEQIKGFFKKRIWVCVSENFDVKRLLKEMLDSLTNKKSNIDTIDAVLHGLQKELAEEKNLFVLDDVWNQDPNKWNDFISRLRNINTSDGSKIVVTTRNVEVASVVGTIDRPYSLEELSNDECWSIFSARAFANGVPPDGDFESLGREIVKKCGGLPLAAEVAGGILRTKKNKNEWRSIANSGVWTSGSENSGVLPILKLSYDNLPSSSLKRCFSYCSIFRKDSVMKKDELIQQWMALGYLQPLQAHDNMQMEDIGNRYFNILVERSLLQDITTNFFGDIKSCKMHDLVHDLAQSLSKSDVFVVEGSAELERGRIPHDIRHLASYSGGVNLDTIGQQVGVKLRTLFFGNIEIGKGFVNFKSLRVLELCQIKKLPTSISDLIHLRYLDLSESEIRDLPDSISKLYHLQTLRLPNTLDRLPDGMRNLISLRHLCFRGYQHMLLPPKLGSLTCLQTLPRFDVDEDRGNQIEELGSLENLRGELEIRNLDAVRSKEDAKRANLSQKSKIYNLTFEWREIEERASQSYNDSDDGVLEGLQPPPNLKSLRLKGFGGKKFPDWVMNMAVNIGGSQSLLDNLMYIELIDCNRAKGIPMLGHLSNLRRLRLCGLDSIKCIDESFYGYKDSSNCRKTIKLFPVLEELRLCHMVNLKEWMGATASQEEVVVFPCLQKLIVHRCRDLKTAAIHFPSLKELEFEYVESGSALVNICSSSTLTSLKIRSAPMLIYLPDALFHNNRHHLMKMIINKCGMLESLPQGLQSCTSLRSLNVCDCRKLKSIPSLEGLNSLTNMDCSGCEMLECLPQGLQSLRSLSVINCKNLNLMASVEDINGCRKVTSLPSYLTCLETLAIGGTTSFKEILHLLQQCVYLRTLRLVGQPECDTLPEQLQYLTALTSIRLDSFGVEALPDWFGKLESLEEIHLKSMRKLKCLPSKDAMQRLTKLRKMRIQDCPLLEARCKEGDRPSGPRFSTIPAVSFYWMNLNFCSSLV